MVFEKQVAQTVDQKIQEGQQLLQTIKLGQIDDYHLTVSLSELLKCPGNLEVAGYVRPEDADDAPVFYPDTRRSLDVYYDVCRDIHRERQANCLHDSAELPDDYRRLNQIIYEITKEITQRSLTSFVLAWRFAGQRAEMFMHSSDMKLEEAMHQLFEEFVEYLRIDLELYETRRIYER